MIMEPWGPILGIWLLVWSDELSSCTTLRMWLLPCLFVIGYIGLIFLLLLVFLVCLFKLLCAGSSSDPPAIIRLAGDLLCGFLKDLSPSPTWDGSLCKPSFMPPISMTEGDYLSCIIDPSFLGSWSGSIDLSPSMLLFSIGLSLLVRLMLSE